MDHDIVIIGAGLSGLTTAYFLKENGRSPIVLEAAGRSGGRLVSVPSRSGQGYFELGATWFADKHIFLNRLIRRLEIRRFEQYEKGRGCYEVMSFMPVQEFEIKRDQEPYYRFAEASEMPVKIMAKHIGRESLRLNSKVETLSLEGDHILCTTTDGRAFTSRYIITTLPPRLLSHSIRFEPELPTVAREALGRTHTWMSQSIKFYVEYERPFWREKGYAGLAMSQTGIIQELHDHTSYEEDAFALMGFLSQKAHNLNRQQREEAVRDHLQRFFGPDAANYVEYVEKVWSQEPLTSTPDVEFVTVNPGYGNPLFQEALYEGRLILSGTETSPVFGGYMEGAVFSGLLAAGRILGRSPEELLPAG